MARAPYILAKTLSEAHSFARETLGLQRGQYRVVTSPSSISGPRGTKLYLVPGYEKRHDRFAMKGALRYTRLEIVDAAEVPAPAPELTPDEEAAEFFAALLEFHIPPAPPAEEVETEEQAEAPAPEENLDTEAPPVEVKRRRRRCTECGVLVDPDEVEQHAAEHAEEG